MTWDLFLASGGVCAFLRFCEQGQIAPGNVLRPKMCMTLKAWRGSETVAGISLALEMYLWVLTLPLCDVCT